MSIAMSLDTNDFRSYFFDSAQKRGTDLHNFQQRRSSQKGVASVISQLVENFSKSEKTNNTKASTSQIKHVAKRYKPNTFVDTLLPEVITHQSVYAQKARNIVASIEKTLVKTDHIDANAKKSLIWDSKHYIPGLWKALSSEVHDLEYELKSNVLHSSQAVLDMTQQKIQGLYDIHKKTIEVMETLQHSLGYVESEYIQRIASFDHKSFPNTTFPNTHIQASIRAMLLPIRNNPEHPYRYCKWFADCLDKLYLAIEQHDSSKLLDVMYILGRISQYEQATSHKLYEREYPQKIFWKELAYTQQRIGERVEVISKSVLHFLLINMVDHGFDRAANNKDVLKTFIGIQTFLTRQEVSGFMTYEKCMYMIHRIKSYICKNHTKIEESGGNNKFFLNFLWNKQSSMWIFDEWMPKFDNLLRDVYAFATHFKKYEALYRHPTKKYLGYHKGEQKILDYKYMFLPKKDMVKTMQ